jgi:hypothetical protein
MPNHHAVVQARMRLDVAQQKLDGIRTEDPTIQALAYVIGDVARSLDALAQVVEDMARERCD